MTGERLVAIAMSEPGAGSDLKQVKATARRDEPYQVREWVEGQNWDEQILHVKQDIRELVEAERFSELPPHQAQLAEYRRKNEEEATPGHWEYRDTGRTVGEHFDSLDDDGKREYLKTRDIRMEKAAPADPGATKGVRVVIDGDDHGVSRTRPKGRHREPISRQAFPPRSDGPKTYCAGLPNSSTRGCG